MAAYPPVAARFLRRLANGVFTLYGATTGLIALTVTFPAWGRNPSSYTILYFPSQSFAAAYVGIFALGLAALLGLVALITSFFHRCHACTVAFLITLALCIPGPALAGKYVQHAGLLPLPWEQQAIAAIMSLIGFLLLPTLAALYVRRCGSVVTLPPR